MKVELEKIVEQKEANVYEIKTKLMANVCSQLPWLCEDLYVESYKLDHYKAIVKDLKETKDMTNEMIMEYWTNKFENFISQDYNVRENSTSTMHRETSTWKFIATIQMLKELNKLIKYSNK